MASRHRKDQNHLDLQGGGLSLNGAHHVADGHGEQSQPEHEEASPAPAESEHSDKIEVSPRAISHLAYRATTRTYGVVGLASRHARPGWAELLRREEVSKGVEVSLSGGQVIINLYVILEYGTRISEVARNIMSNVKFALESSLGVSVVHVNVTVQGIRISE
jgi:uncharacterized alkaline shock family protein YloU